MPGPMTPPDELTLQLRAERVSVSTRRVPDQVVRVATETRTREVAVDEMLTRDGVVVEHVAVGRYVDAAPPARLEGDVTIVPVVEEQVVVTRRLFLREEVHIRRVRTVTPHHEVVTVREQSAKVTRLPAQPDAAAEVASARDARVPAIMRNDVAMSDETIVAVYDTPAHAQLAIADLEASGVPSAAISRHGSTAADGAAAAAGTAQEPGFWSKLFGGETDYDHTVYDRSLQAGSTVVTVTVAEAQAAAAMEILESHRPVDIDERASGYGLPGGAAAGAAAAGAGMAAATTGTAAAKAAATGDTIQLAEEVLSVGKRLVNRGGTRIRRYVVETPVEEQVTLHDEQVVLDRHPVTDGRALKDANFTDKTIEMLETAEEAVVTKTAHVVEEISLRKEAADRVETVHETVRKEDVAIEPIPAGVTAAGGGTVSGATAAKA